MEAILLYAIAGAALVASYFRDPIKTRKAFAKGIKAFEGILPQFVVVIILVAATLTNILVFVGAWSTTKIPMLLFEIGSLGLRFALSRLAIDIVGIMVIAAAIARALPQREIDRMYAEAEKLA